MPTRQLVGARQACEHSGSMAWQSPQGPATAEGRRPPGQDPAHLPVDRPWCANEVVVRYARCGDRAIGSQSRRA